MQVDRLAFLVVTSALLGCGGGGSDNGGTGPPPPPPGTTQTLGSITTNPTSINLVAGNSQTITVTAYDTQGGLIANAGTPTFSSASSVVAEVDGSGTVLGLVAGSTTVNVSLTLGAVTRTAAVALTVTGVLPVVANVSTASGDVFTPNKVVIGQGGSVTWTFSAVTHNVTFAPAAGAPAHISDSYSSSQSRTFTQAGNFSYVCTIHSGMNGQVVVR